MQKLSNPTPCQLYLLGQMRDELPEKKPVAVFEGSGAPEAKILAKPEDEENTVVYLSATEVKGRAAEVLAAEAAGMSPFSRSPNYGAM